MEPPLTDEEVDRRLAPLAERGGILIAVSGGSDSVCLLHLAARWRDRAPRAPALFAATVDHGLRPGSGQEARQVADWAAGLAVPHATLSWSGPKPRAGIQAAARDARYALLEDHAERVGATILLTAHHADDQAETVLMRLVRGSGIHGLSGMAESRIRGRGLDHRRPLLDCSKARLRATLTALGGDWIEDPSNADPRFARTGLRDVLPVLERQGFGRERLLALGERARRADAALDRLAADALAHDLAEEDGERSVLAATALARPDEILLRELLVLIERRPDRGPDPVRLERMEALLAALRSAEASRRALRRTLAGCVVTLDRHARVTISGEKSRQRGRRPGDSSAEKNR